MKYFTLIICFVCIQVSFSQLFSPFNSSQPKRFMNPIDLTDNDYFFYSTLTTNVGDTTFFKQYLRISENYVDVTNTYCSGWGGSFQPTADTTWLGRNFKYNNATQELMILNESFEELSFNFGISLGDSAIFYSGVNSNYFIRYDNLNQEIIIDSMDWIKNFTIWNYDNSGNLSASLLNGFEIKLSKNYGLASFINCNKFPSVEQNLNLMGQLNPTIGYYQLTYDELFPWVPGDSIELVGYNPGYIGSSTTAYNLITIQNRVETSDSVWIYLNNNIQIKKYPASGAPSWPSAYIISYISPIVYKKGTNLNISPNKSTIGNVTYLYDTIDNCGNTKSYNSSQEPVSYCDSCDCFLGYDGSGGSSLDSYVYLENLGMTYSNSHDYDNWLNYRSASIIYSNVGGVTCGTYTVLSIDDIILDNNRQLVKIVDLLGRETEYQPNTIQIYVYSDGTTEKVFKLD